VNLISPLKFSLISKYFFLRGDNSLVFVIWLVRVVRGFPGWYKKQRRKRAVQETKLGRRVVAATLAMLSGMVSAAIAYGQPQFGGDAGVLIEVKRSGRT
jgi:hypothetical protein